MNTIEQLKNYDFDKINLLTPRPLQGGTYFSKVVENSEKLLLQTPKIVTKKGIHKTGKKIYCDLLFDIDDAIFLEWIKNLELKVREIIYQRRELWFYDELTLEDIEYNWINSIKSYKKKFLCRTFLNKDLADLRIFNEYGEDMGIDDLKPNSRIISIIEINGLKFNTTSFHLEFGIKQIMILDDSNKFDKCLIQYGNRSNTSSREKVVDEEPTEVVEEEPEVVEEEPEVVEEQTKVVEEEPEVVEEQTKVVEAPTEIVEDEQKEKIELEVVEKPEEINDKNKEEVVEKNVKDEVKEFINEKETEKKDLEKNDELKEHVLEIPKAEETMNLRDPNEIYLDIYKAAKEKARQAKLAAVKAYLEAKKIKQTYLIDELDTSDDDSEFDDEVFSEK